ncbi:MAG: hypothetical protein FWD57_16450 [Polyangiaceae bacterium]|nr:hypothetical protein [Polyangiaceae bacterium]
MASTQRTDRSSRDARNIGRRIVMIGYYSVFVIVTGIGTWQVTEQAFRRLGNPQSDTPIDCVEGINSLATAISRARGAALTSHAEESEAVKNYRDGLNPEWERRGDIERACMSNKQHLETLEAVVHLGFVEEHAVRREAVELSTVRRKTSDMVRRHTSPAPSTPTNSDP